MPSVGSTNTRLAELAAEGAADRSVLIADRQTAGQGRQARSWSSPEGSGIYLSVLLRPDGVPADRLPWLTMLAGVALVRLARRSGVAAVLKWPNDLLLGDEQRKGAGILAETVAGGVVLGIGLNVHPLPEFVPLGPGGLAPTSLAEAGAGDLDLTETTIALLTELDGLEREWRAGGGDPNAGGLRAEYLSYCVTVGRRVRVELPGDQRLLGVATGVGADGTLLVRADDGAEHAMSAGDVVHVRAEG